MTAGGKAPRRTGLVQVYTGDGKGKTTAALGLALRASGQGLRVGFIQFLKGYARCGEHRFVERWPAFGIVQPAARSVFRQGEEGLRAAAEEALALAWVALASGEYDLLILDEALTALNLKALTLDEVLGLIGGKPASLELVLTGRGAPPEVIDAADLVTEMVPHKHPFDQGVKARRGIEY
ncbi:MAG: cob(I)yrinic acid a,c-diamide adenosyltransferase [Dehalococcoidales bacterium]|nr:cob(I)yrinic acid a,c-diamide adenosyltransferase [Dehalococcoidales bacterium]